MPLTFPESGSCRTLQWRHMSVTAAPYSDVTWVSWHLKTMAIWFFSKSFKSLTEVNNKEYSKALHYCPLCRKSPSHQWIPSQRASNAENVSISIRYRKKDVTPLLTHWSYIFLALTHQFYNAMPNSAMTKNNIKLVSVSRQYGWR